MNRNRILKRIVSYLMVLMMLFTSTGIGPAYALSVEDELAPNGQTWLEAYPTGGFLFKESMKYTEEGGDAVQIEIYRMGGRGGKAVANIAITPVAPEGDTVNAAGFNDFTVTGSAIAPGSYLQPGEFETGFIDVVFEDGEYIKSLELQAVDDDLSEPEELVIFTIFDAEGAKAIEDGNRFTVCIQDDDPYVPSSVYFVADDVSFDKSAGFASLDVVRSGGIQYVFTVDYETVDGSAFAGTDYAQTSGTLQFKGGVDRLTIEVPLINDGIKSPDPDRSFTVKLSNPKGGDIAEGQEEARVSLYNTAAAGAVMNIATLVTDSQAVDISAQVSVGAPVATIADPVTVAPKIKESTPVLEAEPQMAPAAPSGKGGIGPMSIVVPTAWKLAPNQGGYKKYTRLAFDQDKFGYGTYYSNSDDALSAYFDSDDDWHTLTTYNSSAADNNKDNNNINFGFEGSENDPHRIWKVWSDWNVAGANPYGYAIMKQNDLDGLYEFYNAMYGHVSMHLNDAYAWSPFYPDALAENRAAFLLTASDTAYGILGSANKPQVDFMINNNRWMLADHQGRSRKETAISASFPTLLQNGTINVNMDRFMMALLDYHWENNSTFYNWVDDLYLQRAAMSNLRYEVVCRDGDSYLEANGSSVLNGIKPTISFNNDEGGTDNSGNFYIGSKLKLQAPGSAGPFRISKIELKKKEGSAWRVINTGAVTSTGDPLTNKKSGTIQLRSSSGSKTQRMADLSCLTAASGEYSLYVEMEREQTVSVDFSPCILPKGANETQAAFQSRVNTMAAGIAQRFTNATGKSFAPGVIWSGGVPSTARVTGRLVDLSSFNGGLTDGAQLLYGGTMYGGPVPIATADFMTPTIGMIYYDIDAMSREQQVRISTMESVALYLDENDDGRVDEGDTLLTYLNDPKYVNSFFAPERDGDDQLHQQLVKFNYVKVPRKIILSVADDPNLRYDMKASFMTTSTSPSALEKYTAEMKAFREIDTGDTGVLVYGEAAAQGSITVPLGGDFSPPVFDETTSPGAWKWNNPDFRGNLKTPFVNPAQITEYETVVGNKAIPVGKTNDYLGSFRNTDQIILKLYNDSGGTIDSYNSVTTYRDPVLGAFTQNQGMDGSVPSGGDNQQAGDTPGAEKPELNLPDMNIPAGPFEVIIEDNRAGFEVGIPLFGASKSTNAQKTKTEKTGLARNASKYLDDMKDAFEKGGGDNIFNNLKKLAGATGEGLRPKAEYDMSFMFGFSASFMWAYDKADDRWEFDEARIFITFSGEIKISQRLPPVPIIYVYIIFKADVEAGLNIDVDVITNPDGTLYNDVKVSGEIKIEIEVEAGVGIGVELCKFEIYLKVNIGVGFKLADPSYVDEFEIGAALGFRAVFLCFTFEMDAISFKVDYKNDRTTGNLSDDGKWNFEWSVFGQAQPMGRMAAGAGLNQPPKVRLSMSGRTYGDQIIGAAGAQARGGMMLMSIPTDDGNFDLGEYNQGASAAMLAENLSFSSDYKLFAVDRKNYILYVIDGGNDDPTRSPVDADMLVLSEIGGGGLLNPIDGTPGYAVVDRTVGGGVDPTGDLNFDVHVDENRIKVAWTDYQNATPEEAIDPDLDQAMADSAANTRMKYAQYDLGDAAAGFSNAYVVRADTSVYNFLPRVIGAEAGDVVLNVRAEPYSDTEMAAAVNTFRQSLINQLGTADESDPESAAKAKYPYFDLKVGNYKYMNTLYGKYSTFSFGVKTDTGYTITDFEPTDDNWQARGTRIEQMDLYSVSANEFYMAYTTSYNNLTTSKNETVKRLYLRKGTIDENTGAVTLDTAQILRTILDSDDDENDGIYVLGSLNEPFIDPFFGGLEFLEGRLSPGGAAENFLLFNMNNRYYVVGEDSLESFVEGDPAGGELTPFFELEAGEQGDNKGDFSVGTDGEGNISAVYTSPVPYTNNNAIYFTKYDPNTNTWGKGVMLAMRGMGTYEQAEEEGWTEEEAKAEFYKDNYKLIFQKPRVAVSTTGALQLVSQTVMTELEEVSNPYPTASGPAMIKIPKTESGGGEGPALPSKKGFYAMSFPVGKRLIGSPSLIFDTKTFVPGAVLAPRISFKNVGDFALRATVDEPLSVKLMLGDNAGGTASVLAEWNVTSNVPSGGRVDTLADSESTVYGQTGTQIFASPLPNDLNGKFLYFTVNEDADFGDDAFGFSSLDAAGTAGEGGRGMLQQSGGPSGTRASYYSTNQDKAELALDEVSVRQGGEIVTINGVKHIPLDMKATVTNHSEETAAADVRLNVTYRQTDQQGVRTYVPAGGAVPAGALGANGTVSLGTLGTAAQNREAGFITNNNDYKKDGTGAYIILTDGNLDPDTSNDLLVPLSWFDAWSADRSMELRFEVTTSTEEFDDTNNVSFATIQPSSSIQAADIIYVVPNTRESFPVDIESSGGETPDVDLTELLTPGRVSILDEKTYNAAAKTVTVNAENDGETVLRIADKNTASFKDVVVKASSGRADAPSITSVLPRDGSVLIYISPPENTGGGSIINYFVEARNVSSGQVSTVNTNTAAARYEFLGLTNGTGYQFRAAAANAAETGLWSDWTATVIPDAGDYPPFDAAYPAINVQPQDQTVDLEEEFTLELEAATADSGSLSYQWYKNTVNSILGGTSIEGATGAALTASVGMSGVTYYYCEVTNTNNTALDVQTRTVTSGIAAVSVGKGLPVITTTPVAVSIKTGQKLSESQLIGGEANVPGTFAWDNPDFVFTAAGDFAVVFTPDDTENYNDFSIMVHVDLAPVPKSGSSSRTDTSVKIQKTDPGQPVKAEISVTPTVDSSGYATATIPEKSVADAIAKALAEAAAQGRSGDGISIALDIDLPAGADSLGVVLSPAVLKRLIDAGVKSLVINGEILSLDLDLEALKEIRKQGGGDVTLDLRPAKDLSDDAKKLIGTRPVYDVTISYTENGETADVTSLGSGSAQISIPYTPGPDEDPDSLFGVYVDENGNVQRIPGSYYDPVTGCIIIPAGHFSVYGVGYQSLTERFTDIADHWAMESIGFAVGRGLFTGTTDTTFSPNTSMSRGMLVTVLGRLSGADVGGYAASSFNDVAAGKYYLPYIEWAYQQGIIGGVGDNRFAPDSNATREQMAVILQNYAKATGFTLPVTGTAAPFADGGSISGFAKDAAAAMQQASVMTGDQNNRFNPKNGATRAEVAAVLHRYVNLTAE